MFSAEEGNRLDKHISSKACQRVEDVAINEDCLFQCNICEKSYLHEDSLKRHFNWKHKDPVSYNCALCDKSFQYKSALKRHCKTNHKI